MDPAPERFLPWLAVQYNTAPQLDDGPGYTRFDAFVPLRQWDNGLFFVNADGLVNNFDQWGSNLGGGVRSFNRDAARILGANRYWDNRDTDANTFDQAGAWASNRWAATSTSGPTAISPWAICSRSTPSPSRPELLRALHPAEPAQLRSGGPERL